MDKKCFIICPIGKENSETRKRSNKVYDHLLKPVCESLGYDLIRSDKIASAGKIDIEILNYLDSAELAIADLTGLNPNVFYELGYREAKGLPCVQIALEGTELPFDRLTFRTQFYSISDLDKVEEFKTILKKVIQNVESKSTIDKTITNTSKNTEPSIFNIAIESALNMGMYKRDIQILKEDTVDVVFNIYKDRVYEILQESFTIKLSLIDIYKIIGLVLIEESIRHDIKKVLNNFATNRYFQIAEQHKIERFNKEKLFIDISDEILSKILLKFLGFKYIIVQHPNHQNDYELSSQSTYVLTELGRDVLIEITK